MAIQIGASVIYGMNYSDIPEEMQEEIDAMLDDEELDYASPWYDAPRHEWIIGVGVDIWGDTLDSAERELHVAAGRVPDILKGLELGFYVSANVS